MTSAKLTSADVAEQAGVAVQTIHIYRTRGAIPEPDGWTGRSPWWNQSTIDRWLRDRPKRGRPPKEAS